MKTILEGVEFLRKEGYVGYWNGKFWKAEELEKKENEE